MSLINIQNVSLSYGGHMLLDGVNLQIERGDRACLVGRNGTGKSCLLKLLHSDMSPNDGEILMHGDTRVAYLPQRVPPDMSGIVHEVVEAGLAGSGVQSSEDAVAHSHRTIGRVLSHLSLDPDADCAALSGGQKRRVLLARALVSEPDLLLLDEPTNHLDIDSICWMETYLLRHCETFLFVTHDRAFLRRVANRIIDLDRGRLAHWSCDYDTFLRRKESLLDDEKVRRKAFDKELAREEAWIRQGIKARRTRNEGRVRALMQMRETRRARREQTGKARLQLQGADRSGHKVIEATSITFGYDSNVPIIEKLTSKIMRGDKVGIIGPNGSGKTTLLKLFTGELAPQEGELHHGTGLKIGYSDQHRAVIDEDKTVAENAGKDREFVTLDGRQRHIISYLQDFLFTKDRAHASVKILSGGERNRLLLAMLFSEPSNLLIMDEPTNDLDTETLELLEDQIAQYKGTALIVSHDRAFLDNVVTTLLVVEGPGRITEYLGSYTDWLAEQRSQSTVQKKAKPKRQTRPKAFGYNQNRELNGLPKKIEKLEEKQQAMHDRMSEPDYFRTDPDQISADKRLADDLSSELETLYSRWQELEALRDAAASQDG